MRRRELLGCGETSLASKLAAALAQEAKGMLVSPRAGALLLEAACGGEGGETLGNCSFLPGPPAQQPASTHWCSDLDLLLLP